MLANKKLFFHLSTVVLLTLILHNLNRMSFDKYVPYIYILGLQISLSDFRNVILTSAFMSCDSRDYGECKSAVDIYKIHLAFY